MAKKSPKQKSNKLAKRKTTNKRRRLFIYTKFPFRITPDHHRSFLLSFRTIGIARVTYKLTLDRTAVQAISFGGKDVDLDSDRTTDPNVFKNSNPMAVPITDGMLWIVVRAEGKFHQGGGWEMEVSVNGSAIPDSPIKEEVKINNKADHDDLHSVV